MTDGSEEPMLHGAEHATSVSRPYWDALSEGRLVLQHCTGCGRYQHFPRYFCRWCGSVDLDWLPATGGGEIVALTTVHRTSRPSLSDRMPYDLAVVRTDEGPLLMCVAIGVGESGSRGSQAWGRRVIVDFDRTSMDRLLTVRPA
jgi:uncharacterized OB-fold protein